MRVQDKVHAKFTEISTLCFEWCGCVCVTERCFLIKIKNSSEI